MLKIELLGDTSLSIGFGQRIAVHPGRSVSLSVVFDQSQLSMFSGRLQHGRYICIVCRQHCLYVSSFSICLTCFKFVCFYHLFFWSVGLVPSVTNVVRDAKHAKKPFGVNPVHVHVFAYGWATEPTHHLF